MIYRMRLITLISCTCLLVLIPVCFTQATENEQTSATEARKPGSRTFFKNESTEDYHANCPGFFEPIAERGVRGGFTPQCEAILDNEFLNQILPWIPISAKDGTLTWHHVFDKPLAKRAIVLETLRDPVCMETENRPSTDELADRCNANVIADYAALKYACAGSLPVLYRFIERGFRLPPHLTWFERIFDNDYYWERRWRVEYGFFRNAWNAAKCASLPEEALASLGVFENMMEFGGSPAPGEEDWWWAEQGFEDYKLMDVADRLSSNFTRTEYGYESESNIKSAWQGIHPLMAEVLKVKEPGNFSNTTEEKVARLKHFIAASTWMKILREDVDQDWLLEHIGEYSDEEFAQAAEKAKEMMDKQGVGKTWN